MEDEYIENIAFNGYCGEFNARLRELGEGGEPRVTTNGIMWKDGIEDSYKIKISKLVDADKPKYFALNNNAENVKNTTISASKRSNNTSVGNDNKIGHRGKKLTEEEIEKVKRMKEARISNRQIASVMKVNEKAVRIYLKGDEYRAEYNKLQRERNKKNK